MELDDARKLNDAIHLAIDHFGVNACMDCLMLWLWKKRPKTIDQLDLDEIISQTLRWYKVEDPVEYAWFAMALRHLLPQWLKEGKVK